MRLLGDHPLKDGWLASIDNLTQGGPGLPVTDLDLDAEGSAFLDLPGNLRSVIQKRSAFREFCRNKRIPVPKSFCGQTFDEVSAHIVARGKFPVAIKSDVNGSEGAGVFRLEGFRELIGYHERIVKSFPGPVLVEDWIGSPALLEITLRSRGGTLVVQKGLEKKLSIRTSWRLFPVRIPKKHLPAVEKILSQFSDILGMADCLLRLTIALEEEGPVLLAIAGGANRQEYYPGWGDKAGISPLLGSDRGLRVNPPGDQRLLGYLRQYRKRVKEVPFPQVAGGNEKPDAMVVSGNLMSALFVGPDPGALEKRARLFGLRLQEEP